MEDPGPGDVGDWGWVVFQLMGYVNGVPQHIGVAWAGEGKSGGGSFFNTGDWSHPGELFSHRSPGFARQPHFQDA